MLQSRCWLKLQVPEGLPGPVSKVFISMPGKIVLVVGRLQFLTTWTSVGFLECPSDMALAFPRVCDLRES